MQSKNLKKSGATNYKLHLKTRKMNLITTRKKINELLSDFQFAKKQLRQEKQNLIEAEDNYTNTEQAQQITQQIAQTIQQQAHNKIARVVSRCLETVFDDEDYGFKIHFERKRGKTEAKLVLTKNNNEIENPLDADSGGVLDVAAFALRLSSLILAKPKLRRLVVLDEPFKFVSAEYLQNVKLLLEGLARDFKVQFIMVTHIKQLQIGKVIEI